ncbi:MAG TPA: thioredoxin domain-containing protein [Polyangiales bacterium]|nr:thioredoxin domain-containing protein [Polyangiales bacterium]
MFSPRFRFSARIGACLLAAGLFAGCAAKSETTAGTVPTQAKAGTTSACEQFTSRLCSELGAKTDACMSLRSVREWFPEKACEAALADIEGSLARVRSLRGDCDQLAQKICAELGEQSPVCEEVKHDLPEVPVGQCRMLLSHYPELIAQLRTREQRTQPLSPEAWSSLLAGTPASLGPETAKVTIVEFSDFQCPYCAAAHDTVHQVRERYPQVRIVFRHFPLAFHEHARIAAQAAMAAHAQGKFWAYHDRLFEHQNALDRKSLEGYAQELGLDVQAFKKGLDDNSFDAQVEADVALGKSVRVDGTPTMFVNGRRAENATEFDAVAPLIDAALAAN